jgi:hypothetical protein
VGGFGWKTANRAAGARSLHTKCSGARIWLEGTLLGRGKLGFEGWEARIYQHARVGDLGAKIKIEPLGLGLHQ